MKYSKYQEGVFDFVKNQTGNAIVQAVAGSGKSTTVEHAIRDHVPYMTNVLACAFNRHIAAELATRMPEYATALTMNQFGHRAVSKHFGKIKFSIDKVDFVLRTVLKLDWSDKDSVKNYYSLKGFIKKIVDLLRNLNVTDLTNWVEHADRYDIPIPSNKPNLDTLVAEVYMKVIKDTKFIDYGDQLFFPVYYDISLPKHEQVWADESQDLNPIQIEIIKRIGGRVFAVGDTNQAIYGFRGADPFAMRTIQEVFNCVELPLSICYRCAKNVVLEAQKIVPHIEYAEGAVDGVVDSVKHQFYVDNVSDKDWVLCRTTAPLVKECLARIAEGRKAAVKGRDIGDNIIRFLDEISDPCSITELGPKVQDYLDKKLPGLKAAGRDIEVDNLQDRAETLRALMSGCTTSEMIKLKINEIFSDDSDGIMYATVHRSKGLETDRVWLLRPDLLPHPSAKLDWQKVQEQNLKYVAITRAKKEFYYVGDVLQ